jgi:hypothetical protein
MDGGSYYLRLVIFQSDLITLFYDDDRYIYIYIYIYMDYNYFR